MHHHGRENKVTTVRLQSF